MISCSCGNTQCFVCSENVEGHDHFGYEVGDCPMFDNTLARQRREVASAQEESVKTWLQMDVALKEDDILIDPSLRNPDDEQLANNTSDEENPYIWRHMFFELPDWLGGWPAMFRGEEEHERQEREREQRELEERERQERERAETAEQVRREAEQIERALRKSSQERENKRNRKRMTRARKAQEQLRQSKNGWSRASRSQKLARHR